MQTQSHTRRRAGLTGSRPESAYERGFTLIELLVVIAIVTVLTGILLPALGRAKKHAKNIVCIANMRQIGIALQAYLADNQYRLPPSACHIPDPNQYWLCVLASYSREGLLFRCPGDRARNFLNWRGPQTTQPENARWSSFSLNGLLDPPCHDHPGRYNNVLNIRRPMSCICVAEAPDSWTQREHVHPDAWACLDDVREQVAWDRHCGRSNYLFVDGHVEHLTVDQTWTEPGRGYWFPGDSSGHAHDHDH